jgi:hypothetical protein
MVTHLIASYRLGIVSGVLPMLVVLPWPSTPAATALQKDHEEAQSDTHDCTISSADARMVHNSTACSMHYTACTDALHRLSPLLQ